VSGQSLHLWEIDHPYYATEGNFYANGMHGTYTSWAEFAQPSKGVSFNVLFMQPEDARGPNLLYDFDDDLNYLWRWDWQRSDPADYEYELAEDPTFEPPGDRLLLFFMQQRKARCNSAEIKVTEADEPAVREWLTAKARHVALTWEPFLEVTP
jgi:hypothetical protein